MSSIVPWQNLPLEVWSIVLDQLNNVRQLATCRLVCKSWDPLAERAMFKQKCQFNRPEAQRKYYNHLVKKPALAQFIPFINILRDNKIGFYNRFLELAFTSNVKTIDCNQIVYEKRYSKKIYNLLLRTAQQKSEDYTLEYLVQPPVKWDDVYVKTLLFFKKTLTCLELDFLWSVDDDSNRIKIAILDRKNEFECLRTIRLNVENVESLTQVETLLRRCTPIQELELNLYAATTADLMESKEALEEWMVRHVQKDASVRKLTYLSGQTFKPAIAYYLLYKYPQLATAHIENLTHWDSVDNVSIMFDALKDLPSLSIGPWVTFSLKALKALISNTKSQQNALRISGGISSISVKRFKSPGITEFTITERPQAMEEIVSRVSAVSLLDISYGIRDAWKQIGQSSSLYRVLEAVAPHIQKLTFQDSDIQCPPPSYTASLCNHLSQLEIKGAKMDKRVLSSLSTIAPNLQYLTLNTCLIDDKCHQSYHVVMPKTDFKCLSIVTNDNVIGTPGETMARLKQDIDIKDYQRMTLQVTTSKNQQTHYFILKAGIPTQFKQISLEDYTYIANGWPKTVVECKSIQYIKFDLGKLMNTMVNLKAAAETGRIQPLGDWTTSCRAAILPTLDDSSTLEPGLFYFMKVSPADSNYQERLKSIR